MSIVFYTASGAVPGWKIHLILEHKQIPYELKMLSHQDGDFKKPEYLAINPRGTVPCIADGDFALWESSVIGEYLEEKWPERPMLPKDARERARIRRIAMEAQMGLGDAVHNMGRATFMTPDGKPDAPLLEKARGTAKVELQKLDRDMRGPFFGGESLSLADATVYPIAAMIQRITTRFKLEPLEFGQLAELVKRVEAQPYFDRTYPPHWRA